MGDTERSESGKKKEIVSLEDLQLRVGRAVCYTYNGGSFWQYAVIPVEYDWSVQEKKFVLIGPIREQGWRPNSERGITLYDEETPEYMGLGMKSYIFESDFSKPDFSIRATSDEEINGRIFPNGFIPLREDEPLVIPPINEPPRTYSLSYGNITFLPPTGKLD